MCAYGHWIRVELFLLEHVKDTLRPVHIQTEAFFGTDSSRDAEYHREQTLCHSVRKSNVLRTQPLDEA